MTAYRDFTREELLAEHRTQTAALDAWKAKGLALNMARGKPSPEQLATSLPMLDALGSDADLIAEDGTDARNYGCLQGLPEARRLMAALLHSPAEHIIICGESSLNAEYDALARFFLFGTDGHAPWSTCEEVRWLCPVPGYDRHFAMAEAFGMTLVPVALTPEGPDLDEVERLVADERVKGIWCVPQYANPDGCTYSDEVVERLATMRCAAPDFRIFWDNAYAVHHLRFDGHSAHVADIGSACEEAGNPRRYLKFASTSKITFPGAGLAAVAGSAETVAEILGHMRFQTIGHDKLNQLRHVAFLRDEAGLMAHMRTLAALIAPKFALVQEMLHDGLDEADIATWTDPAGGYFVFFRSMPGCAKRIVELAKEAGVTLTKAGATWPYGVDPYDTDIRIAPTYPDIDELRAALGIFVVCVKIASCERLLAQQ